MADNPRVLLIDDDSAIHQLVATVLSSEDWTVEIARDSREAEKRVARDGYDVIITGLASSPEDDLRALRRMRRARPHTKMVVMTAASTPEAVVEALRGHAFGYFVKPFSRDDLLDIIHRALEAPAWDDGIQVVSAKPEFISVRVRCRVLSADRLVHFMDELRMDLAEDEKGAIGAAFREMLLNAIEHGGKLDPEESVDITCVRTDRIILYYIRDPGPGFSFEHLPHAAASCPEDPLRHVEYRVQQGMRAGGFGILTAQGLVDDVIHNEQGNEVVLIKYLR